MSICAYQRLSLPDLEVRRILAPAIHTVSICAYQRQTVKRSSVQFTFNHENILPRYAAGLLLMVIFRRRRIDNCKKIEKETSGSKTFFMEKTNRMILETYPWK